MVSETQLTLKLSQYLKHVSLILFRHGKPQLNASSECGAAGNAKFKFFMNTILAKNGKFGEFDYLWNEESFLGPVFCYWDPL